MIFVFIISPLRVILARPESRSNLKTDMHSSLALMNVLFIDAGLDEPEFHGYNLSLDIIYKVFTM